ncbi:glycosyltransferase family 4 protein [Flectobacillus major]|uniref:glycosyltransferase family 4 protein n=1 Tax=Flectobacillus major TaxID=103 RepID=UPI0003F51120|nr:glycosyltransferase family 1 protein [Flectobacillus major]
MKVIFDTSLLGMGYYNAKARTGIFRVAEHLAYALNKKENITLNYVAEQSLRDAMAFVKDQMLQPDIAFVHEPKAIRIAQFQNSIIQLFEHNSIFQKAVRHFFNKLSGFYHPIDTQQLSTFDIYHSPYFPIPKLIQQRGHIKKVITIHDLIPIKYPQFFQSHNDQVVATVLKDLQKYPDTHVICISESTKADLLELSNIKPEQVFVTHLAASKDIFYPEYNPETIKSVLQTYQIPTDVPYFLSLATFEPRKNIESTIKAFVQLIQEQKDTQANLVLVGTKGWDFEGIFENLNIAAPLRKRIMVTGYMPDHHLASIYSGATAFVFVSFCEGFGLPPLEAMQCGTPVIVSNTTSLPEVVGDAGITVNPTDINGISGAMLNLLNNHTQRNQLIAASLARSTMFTWEKMGQQTLEVYQKLS